ncbi:hypothetical protein [Lacipirellula sp.]|uniref:hypothetical protein n=1 Tax=Lacipirellula sp. TaxID=2691419 RepID=UPI003D13C5B9
MHTVSISFTAILFVALLFMLAAFALARLLRSLLGANGAIWLTLAGLVLFGMLLLAMFRAGISVPQPVEVVTQLPQVSMMQTTVTTEVEPVEPPQAAKPTDSIEEMWKQLTAPRINLEETAVDESVEVVHEAIGPSSPQELTQAARVILSASVPGADPFTQGWLVNAAKSILDGRAVPPPPAAPAAPTESVKVTQKIQEDLFAETPRNAPQPPVKHPNPFAAEPFVEQAKSLPKPDWVINPPKQVGNVRKIVVVSDPYSSDAECRRDLDGRMSQVVLDRIDSLASKPIERIKMPMLEDTRWAERHPEDRLRSEVMTLFAIGVPSDYIRRELCADEYMETVDASVGPMRRAYALLEFNETQDAILVNHAVRYARRNGVLTTSLLGGGLLASVATLFGLLKVDTWTRGYYTKRLFLGVPAAIITVLALLFVS